MKKISQNEYLDFLFLIFISFVSISILKKFLTVNDINTIFLFHYNRYSIINSMQLFTLLIWIIPRIFLILNLFQTFTRYYQENFLYFRIREPKVSKWTKLVVGSMLKSLIGYELSYYVIFSFIFKLKLLELDVLSLFTHLLSFSLLILFVTQISVLFYLITKRGTQVINIVLIVFICITIYGLFNNVISSFILLKNPMSIYITIFYILVNATCFQLFRNDLNNREYYH